MPRQGAVRHVGVGVLTTRLSRMRSRTWGGGTLGAALGPPRAELEPLWKPWWACCEGEEGVWALWEEGVQSSCSCRRKRALWTMGDRDGVSVSVRVDACVDVRG